MAVNKKILIVEDDIFVSDIYRQKFISSGYDVHWGANGKEAVEILKKEIPDLIMLDVMMPKMDGLEFLRWLENNDELKGIPVIMLTNISQNEQVENLKGRVADYIVKSYLTPSEVLKKVEKVLESDQKK